MPYSVSRHLQTTPYAVASDRSDRDHAVLGADTYDNSIATAFAGSYESFIQASRWFSICCAIARELTP